MKKLRFETKVNKDAETVFAGFDKMLFEALIPTFPPVKLLRFDGSEIGDEVHLQMGLMGVYQNWVSVIVDRGEDEAGYYFVDEGLQLPFFLKKWRHIHRINRAEHGSVVIDDISYESSWKVPSPIVHAALHKQFADRGPLYRKYFDK